MAVKAVVSVVIRKLTDMLNYDQEPVGFDKEIDQMKEIRSKLMTGFLIIDAGDNRGGDKAVKKWADEYLCILYNVEDIVETFAIGIARQRERRSNTRIGAFFNNYATPFFFFFNNLKAQKLRRKMACIGARIDSLNNAKPGSARGTKSFKSLGSVSSFQNEESHHRDQQNSFGHSGQAEEDQEEEEEEEEIDGCIISPICPGESTAAQIPNRGPSFGEHLRQATLTSSCSYEEEESGIVGFQEQVIDLVERLTSDEGNGSRSNVLAIVGAVGSGKTKLAQAIYKSKGIKKDFDCRAWVYVSQDYTKRDLLLSLLKQVDSCKDQGVLNPEQMLDRLSKLLEEKKCLVVIDDVRTAGDWDKLKDAFRNTGINGSKIIVTTPEEKVALSVDPWRRSPFPSPHYMKGLTDEESWKMFLKKARLPETFTDPSQDPDMFELHHRILEICKGLPLWIVLLGGLLSTKKISYKEWSQVLDSIHPHPMDILRSCYNDLPVHSKLCLLYMVLFPKEYDIPVRRLVRLWLAEGFVKRPSSKRRGSAQKMPEDVAQEYFDDLVNRNMIEISKSRSDGSPRRCRLPGALHDYLLPETQDISLFHIHRNSGCNTDAATGPSGLRRIVEYLNIKNCSLDFSRLQYLRSYISFNLQKKDIPAGEVANFVSRMTRKRGFALLTVLDLEGVYKPSLPDKLGDLFHLRYLGLRWTFLDSLPPSVGDLPYLETLDLKHTYINSLPNSVWKLKHLRHLNLSEIRLDMPEQPHRTLTGLLTLWGLFVDDKSPVKNGLSRLHDLRELGITFTLSSSLDLTDWISNLISLQSLRLRSKDEMGRPSELHLKPLSCLLKLSHLNLMGKLQKLPDIHEFPPGLKVLTLSVSLLTDDPMPTLGQLQSLTVLRLLADSYQRNRIVCPRGGFSKLRVLKLWMLRNLEEWVIKEGAMQNLKELNIRCCDRLRILPPSLLRLSTFEELTLTNMPASFVAKVKQQKSEHTLLTVNKLDFSTPSPCEQDNVSDRVLADH